MESLSTAIDILSKYFETRNWRYLKVPEESQTEKVFARPGTEDEEIMICVHKGCDIHELCRHRRHIKPMKNAVLLRSSGV